MGTPSTEDDLLLHESRFEPPIVVAALADAPDAEDANAASLTIEFGPNGYASGGAITLFDGDDYRRVAVDASSRLVVEQWSDGRWTSLR